jgi:hypothetical protein
MKIVRSLFGIGYSAVSFLFYACGITLIVFAALELWSGISPGAAAGPDPRIRFDAILEAIALLTIAVAALELGQTIFEEEVLREAHISAPTRVRRFLSRFLIVIIVSLSIETLVAVFHFINDDPAHLTQASMVGIATAALLAAWGVFIRLNRSAEELEPEAMEKAKGEDEQLE